MRSPSVQNTLLQLQQVYDELGATHLAYLVAPNVILTLSGCRPMADGVYYSKDATLRQQWLEEMRVAIRRLDTPWSKVYEDTNPMGDTYATFDILMWSGLEWVLSQTTLLSRQQKQTILSKSLDENIQKTLLTMLAESSDIKHIPSDAHGHIATGILLGYPDTAILGAVAAWENSNSSADLSLVPASITHAHYYDCPQPVYDYPKSLENDPSIIAHQQLWNHILEEFYSSSFHKMLLQDKIFRAKVSELGLEV